MTKFASLGKHWIHTYIINAIILNIFLTMQLEGFTYFIFNLKYTKAYLRYQSNVYFK